MKKNYQLLDIAKFFFSICIIGIHTKFLGEYKIGYYIETNIFRIAVPFFFICNGYFIAKSMDQNSFDNKKLKKIVVKRLSLWYLNESGENQYFMRRRRGKSPFVENCLSGNT